jgi:hypothetical protein
MYFVMEGKGAADGDRREENEYLVRNAPVRVCGGGRGDGGCDDEVGDEVVRLLR